MDIIASMQDFEQRVEHKTLRRHLRRADVDAVVRCALRLQRRFYMAPSGMDRERYRQAQPGFTLGPAKLHYVILDELLNMIAVATKRTQDDATMAQPQPIRRQLVAA